MYVHVHSESLYSEGENDEKEHSELKSSQQQNPWLQHASKGSSVKCDGVLLLDKEVQHDESSKLVQGQGIILSGFASQFAKQNRGV